ncbi:MAG: RagB/SusD family nutrient uptake outer membrane protein [Thermoflexibacter sp.]|jgi:tetratricopeptide (TPR) repeat protein|nr:RagB/SusD family nutrient uptake outer membrane protein [Thermoflexibacter sp.]
MIKNIKIGFFFIALALLSFACGERLNVEPTQSVSETTALNDDQAVKVTLAGAYDGLSNGNLYAGAIQFSGDFLGDDREFVFGGTFTNMDELWRKALTTTNATVSAVWLNAYRTINISNNILAALDKVEQADRGRVEGEALFIRGSLYFELVKLYAKFWDDGNNASNPGVPLVLTPTRTVTEADNRARNNVAEVYTQIIADLTKAENLMPNANGIFANKFAAAAMLSRVYLAQGRYAEARDAANRVITSGRFAIARSFADAFIESAGDYGREHIFRIAITDQDGVNSMNTFYASSAFQGRGDVRVQTKHLALYETGDIRRDFFYRTGTNTFTSKYRDLYGDVPVLRITEMYLTRAEANFRLNAQVGATPQADINLIRQRAGLPPLANLTLAAILRERKLELAFEGQQVWDLKRTKTAVNTTFNWNSERLIFPIPQREIDTNKSLTQNTGY